jgi:hypothetical protein
MYLIWRYVNVSNNMIALGYAEVFIYLFIYKISCNIVQFT